MIYTHIFNSLVIRTSNTTMCVINIHLITKCKLNCTVLEFRDCERESFF